MINIEQREAKKVPGLTSFFISFDYSSQVVTILKELYCRVYDAKTKEWEIPETLFTTAVDSLIKYDDIHIKFMKDKSEKAEKEYKLSNYKLNLFDHQKEAIQYGLNHDKWLLLDPPGLGKTLQAICLADEHRKKDKIEHCLVICGVNNIKWNWIKEIEKSSDLSAVILGQKELKNGKIVIGSVKDRLAHLKSKIKEFFIVTNIETLRNKDVVNAIKKGPNKIDMIVFDEVHTAKDPSTHQGRGMLSLKDFKYKVAMTGTLLVNNPLDVYMPLRWIGVEKSSLSVFKANYCVLDGRFGFIQGYRNMDYLKMILDKYSLRRQIELPIMNIIDDVIEMNDQQQLFYDNIVHGVVDQVDKVKLSTSMLLSMVTRLRQATALPSILTSDDSIKSSKVERALDLINEITSNGEKVVVFSTFKQPLYELEKDVKLKHVVATGDEKDAEISARIDQFQNDPSTKVFLATWQKCGTGITLTAAKYMIFLDTPWTEAVFDQACKRIHRIGTTSPVFIYRIICKNSYDERVNEILSSKKALSEYIIDDVQNQGAIEYLRKSILDLANY